MRSKAAVGNLLKTGDDLTTWRREGLVVRELPRRALSRGRELRLEVEAERMRALRSPRLAPFLLYSRAADELSTEVEFIPGQTLAELLPLAAEDVLPLALDLFEALRQLHGAGALHRHLKPSRLVLTTAGAVLIWPGLARRDQTYLAPEAAGSLARHVGPSSDLYAAGGVLFHALTGRTPFSGPDLVEAHLCAPVPRPGSRLRGLDEVVVRLLAKEPQDRYLSADAVAADLAELRARPYLVPGAAERRDTLVAEPAFVGRDEELQIRPGVRVLCAPSGAGKSRLLHELSLRAPGLVLWGRHRPEDPSSLPLLGEITRLLRRDQALAQALRTELEWECRTLAGISPELAVALGVEPWSEGPEEQGRRRLARALVRILEALRPGLIVLDDLQWAGELTLQLVEQLAATSVAVVGTVRTELLPPDWSLPTLTLPALTDPEVARLALSMAGPLPDSALEIVTRLAEGNPFVAVESLRGLVDTGALRFAEGWRFEGRVEAGEGAAGLLGRRLAELRPATRRTLAMGAVVGRDFALDLLAAAAGEPPAELVDRLEEAGIRRIIWSSAGGGYSFVHDRLREQCLDTLSQEERRAAHERLATFLEDVRPLPYEQLALHWDSAGQSRRAAPHARLAAARMRQMFAWREAELHLRIAARGGQPDPLGLAQVLKLRGDYAGACQVLTEWAPGSPFEEAERLAEQAEIAVKRNEVDQAARLTEAALGVLGRTQPHGRWACRRHLLAEVLRQVAHTYRPPTPHPAAPEGLLAARLLESLTLIRYFQGRSEEMLLSHLAGLNLAQTYPPTPVLMQSVGLHASVMTHAGLLQRARRFGEQAVNLAGSAWERAQALSRRAYVDLQCGRLPAARVGYEEAETLFERTGDPWELALARQNLIEVYLGLGELERGRELCRVNLAAAAQNKDWSALTVSLRMHVRLTGGDLPPLPPELKRLGESQSRDHHLLEAVGVALQFAGHFEASLQCLEGSLAAGRTTTSLDIIATLNWLGTTCRRWAEASPGRRASLQRQGRRYLREAERLGRRYRRHLPQTLRELAWLEPARARRHLEESLAVARELSLALEEALTRQARGLLTEAEDDLTWSRLRLLELGALWALPEGAPAEEVSPALLQRFDRFPHESGRILAANSPADVLERLADAARTLLRGQTCQVVSAGPGVVGEALAGGSTRVAENGRSCELACPLPGGEACLYLAHDRVSGLFGPEEVRLARFLCEVAGAALTALRSGRRFRSLFLGAGVGIALVDAQGEVLQANPTLAAMLGLERVGRLYEHLPGDDRAAVAELVRAACAGRAGTREQRYRGGPGRWLWGQLTATPTDEGAVLALADISYRKVAEVVDVQEAERRLLAAELHDLISQPLVGLMMRLEEASDPRLSGLCRDVLDRMGHLMCELRASGEAAEELLPGLQDMLDRFERRTGVAARLSAAPLPPTGRLTAIFAARIIGEALANVARHSGATRVDVELAGTAGWLQGVVADDGCGFAVEAERPRDRHFGLWGMLQRAELLGGQLRVLSEPGRGTRVEFELPLEESDAPVLAG